jgi:hypothetical protein
MVIVAASDQHLGTDTLNKSSFEAFLDQIRVDTTITDFVLLGDVVDIGGGMPVVYFSKTGRPSTRSIPLRKTSRCTMFTVITTTISGIWRTTLTHLSLKNV